MTLAMDFESFGFKWSKETIQTPKEVMHIVNKKVTRTYHIDDIGTIIANLP